MSFADVLSAARELSADEQAALVRQLTAPSTDGVPEHLRPLLPPPGATVEYWHPTTDDAGRDAIRQALAEMTGGGPK